MLAKSPYVDVPGGALRGVPRRVALVGYEGFQLLDITGPV